MLWRQYGAVGIGTYFGIYFGSIAFFYVVYDYGVLTNLPSGGTAVIERVSVVGLLAEPPLALMLCFFMGDTG